MRTHLRLALPLLLVLALAACSDSPNDLTSKAPVGPSLNTTQTACIGDLVWEDLNGNGCQDDGEPPVEGVTVEAYRCSDDGFVASDETDAAGYYSIFVDPGDYYLKIVAPGFALTDWDQCDTTHDSDINPSTGESKCTTVAQDQIIKNLDIGLIRENLACVGDRVWFDENCNGCQDKDEPGVEGILVELWSCDDKKIDEMYTDEKGIYCFDDLEPGEYKLFFNIDGDWEITQKDACGNDAIDSDAGPDGWIDCKVLEGCKEKICDVGLCLRSEGCTPGYWKNHIEVWAQTPYSPGDSFNATFGCEFFSPDLTLEQAINQGGGKEKRVGRHGVAALLSAAHANVEYALTVEQVKEAVCAMNGDLLAENNEKGCPLNKWGDRGDADDGESSSLRFGN